MRQRHTRLKVAVACLLLLVVPLFSMYFHGRQDRSQTLLETVLVEVTAPGQRTMSAFFANVVAVWKRYFYLVEVEKQNEELRKAIGELKLSASWAQGQEEENRRLRAMLDFKTEQSGLELASAGVIAREVSPFFSVSRIRLDRGGEDLVKVNMPVVTSTGVVGRIEKVAGEYCDVMLLTDTRCRIDVQVPGKAVSGTLIGMGDSLPVFRIPYQKTALEKGDPLITTGHDRMFPKGLVVGYLTSGEVKQVGRHLESRVEPAVRFAALQEVFVVTNESEAVLAPGTIPGGQK